MSVATTGLVALTALQVAHDSRRRRTRRESFKLVMLRNSRRARNTMGALTVASFGFIVTGS